ncbi:MAG: hypothetical protein RLZZ546_1313 [Bacteroidota bacterium]|jgi:hypothetical protein
MQLINKLILAFCAAIIACTEPIQYDVSRENSRVVISGQLTDSLEYQTIRVSKSVLLSKDDLTQDIPIDNASIQVITQKGEVYDFFSKGQGIYTSLFKGQNNEKYKAQINIEGTQYESEFEQLLDPSNLPTIKSELVTEKILTSNNTIVEEVSVSLQSDNTLKAGEHFLYRVYGEYEFQEFNPPATNTKACYITTILDESSVSIASREEFKSGVFEKKEILKTSFDYPFRIQYCFHVSQHSINEKAYRYWNKVNQTLKIGTNLFDPPPGKIIGNFKNVNNPDEEVLGYFTVSSVKYVRHFTNMGKLNALAPDPCRIRFNQTRPAECADCLTLPFSSSQKPPYWF